MRSQQRLFEFHELPASVQEVFAPLAALERIEGEDKSKWYRRSEFRDDRPPVVAFREQDFVRIRSAINWDRMPSQAEYPLWVREFRFKPNWQPSFDDLNMGAGFSDYDSTVKPINYNPLEFTKASMFPLSDMWLVTQEIKDFFEAEAPDEVFFMKAPFVEDRAERGVCYLMDAVIREDMVDFDRSRIRWQRDYDSDLYRPVMGGLPVLRDDIADAVNVFRTIEEPKHFTLRRSIFEQANALGGMLEPHEYGAPPSLISA
ncbi:MAG: hypothetical protein GYB36_09310 [Alphaproteobacteria bacterium]|nr:hypothetical protein [Alphaproteobacteria bacterium]